jgi:hydrogenase maturation protease
VIGVGNRYRGDDAVGIEVARRVLELAPEIPVQLEEAEPVDLMDRWEGAERVVVVDAVVSDCAPGTVHRFEPVRIPLPAQLFRYSTHSFSVAEAVELARTLDRLPAELVLYGIEGERFAPGAELSPAVSAVVDEVARRIVAEVTGHA